MSVFSQCDVTQQLAADFNQKNIHQRIWPVTSRQNLSFFSVKNFSEKLKVKYSFSLLELHPFRGVLSFYCLSHTCSCLFWTAVFSNNKKITKITQIPPNNHFCLSLIISYESLKKTFLLRTSFNFSFRSKDSFKKKYWMESLIMLMLFTKN